MLKTDTESILKSVSRSFYLSLRVLPSALRPVMGLGYLLCRAADTLTDEEVIPSAERLKTLKAFRALFDAFPISKEKSQTFLKTLTENRSLPQTSEGLLLFTLPRIIESFNALAMTDQALVHQVVQAVTQGMEMDLSSFGDGVETLKAFQMEKELETYIGLIGGEPGRFWIQACLHHIPALTREDDRLQLIEQGFLFGTGLQMVNILRDLPKDLMRGRCYIPEERLSEHTLSVSELLDKEKNEIFLPLYHELIDETLERLRHGLTTLESIPAGYFRLRAAIWWPLVIGVRTLEKLRLSPVVLGSVEPVKVKRFDIYKLMIFSLFLLPSNRLLRQEFDYQRRGASSSL